MPTTICLGRPHADLLHHLEIDPEQIVAAHARLARHAGGDDAHAGAGDRVVGIGAGELGVETVDWGGLHEIERLALRNAFGNVEQHHVAKVLEADEMGERAADLAGTDQSNLGTRHVGKNLGSRGESGGMRHRPFPARRSSHRTTDAPDDQ
jgi:hypothetical protein